MRSITPIAFVLLITLGACEKKQGCTDQAAVNYDANAETDNGSCIYPGEYENGALILNEGNFQFGNASLSYFDRDVESVKNGIFEAINGVSMGDVAQSMTVIGDHVYVVVNNSGKVWKINLSDLKVRAEVTGFPSPRYLVQVSDSKAYVSNFQGDEISILDLNSNAIVGQIAMDGWTEEMAVIEDHAYVLGMRSNQIYKVDPQTDQLTDSLYLGVEPYCIEVDGNGKLWVQTTGGLSQQEFAKLFQIDPTTFSVEQEITFPSVETYPSNLTFSADYQSLYFTAGEGLFKMDVSSGQIPNSPIVNGSFYGMKVDPETGVVYATDAVDYNQRGYVYRFTESGAPIDTFQLDVIPSFMLFTSS